MNSIKCPVYYGFQLPLFFQISPLLCGNVIFLTFFLCHDRLTIWKGTYKLKKLTYILTYKIYITYSMIYMHIYIHIKLYVRCFIYSILFTPNISVKQMVLSPFYRWENGVCKNFIGLSWPHSSQVIALWLEPRTAWSLSPCSPPLLCHSACFTTPDC